MELHWEMTWRGQLENGTEKGKLDGIAEPQVRKGQNLLAAKVEEHGDPTWRSHIRGSPLAVWSQTPDTVCKVLIDLPVEVSAESAACAAYPKQKIPCQAANS